MANVVLITGDSPDTTSLLWALAGHHLPEGVAVTPGAEPGGSGHQSRPLATFIPQGNALAMTLTAAENLVLPLLAVGTASAQAEERSRSALELLGLADCGNHLVEELSGGQQQRVSIARALSLDPHIIIADDPTNDLDAPNRQRVLRLLGDHASRGGAVVLASAEPDAVVIATRVITT